MQTIDFLWWWLTFNLREFTVEKVPALFKEWWCMRDQNRKRYRKRWAECSLAQRQQACPCGLVAVIDILTQVVGAVCLCVHVPSAELWLLRASVGITLWVVEPRYSSPIFSQTRVQALTYFQTCWWNEGPQWGKTHLCHSIDPVCEIKICQNPPPPKKKYISENTNAQNHQNHPNKSEDKMIKLMKSQTHYLSVLSFVSCFGPSLMVFYLFIFLSHCHGYTLRGRCPSASGPLSCIVKGMLTFRWSDTIEVPLRRSK